MRFQDSELLDEFPSKMLPEIKISADRIAGSRMGSAQFELCSSAVRAATVSGKQPRRSARANHLDDASWQIAFHRISAAQKFFGFAHQFASQRALEHCRL